MAQPKESPFASLSDPNAPWLRNVRAELADMRARGVPLYKLRKDGALVERIRDQERVIRPPRA